MLLLSLLIATAVPNYTLPIMDKEEITASAALLSPTMVITAEHAVGAEFTTVFLRCGEDLAVGMVVKTSKAVDLALVQLIQPCFAVQSLKLAGEDPPEATWALIQGYPAGRPRKTVGAIIAGYERVPYQDGFRRYVMMLDSRITGGNSGGPVIIGDALVGIISAGVCYSVSACFGAAISASVIRTFLGLN